MTKEICARCGCAFLPHETKHQSLLYEAGDIWLHKSCSDNETYEVDEIKGTNNIPETLAMYRETLEGSCYDPYDAW